MALTMTISYGGIQGLQLAANSMMYALMAFMKLNEMEICLINIDIEGDRLYRMAIDGGRRARRSMPRRIGNGLVQ